MGNEVGEAELKGAQRLTVGKLMDRLRNAHPDQDFAIAAGDDPAQFKMLAMQTGAQLVFVNWGDCPPGTVWGGIPTSKLAMGMFVMPKRAEIVQDKGVPKLFVPG